MENQVNITFALDKEASDRLAHIEGLLTAIYQELASGKEQVLQTVAPTPAVFTAPEEPKTEAPAPTPAPDPEKLMAEAKALVQHLATPATGLKDAVRAIVNQYAERVSLVPADKLPEMLTKLHELEAKA